MLNSCKLISSVIQTISATRQKKTKQNLVANTTMQKFFPSDNGRTEEKNQIGFFRVFVGQNLKADYLTFCSVHGQSECMRWLLKLMRAIC